MGACGVGSLPEVADGEAPFAPRGCIAQAWSVGETLRAWHLLVTARPTPAKAARTPAARTKSRARTTALPRKTVRAR